MSKIFLCCVGANVDLLNYRFINASNYFIKDNKIKEITCNVTYTSATLPQYLSNEKGKQIYLTDLNKPAWWTGSKWVDATGTEI